MPFGIEDLSKKSDVEIRLFAPTDRHFNICFTSSISVEVRAEIEKIKDLPGWSAWESTPGKGSFLILPPASEGVVAIAERIALSLEVDFGLKVARLVRHNPEDRGTAPTKEVQSFILA